MNITEMRELTNEELMENLAEAKEDPTDYSDQVAT